MIEIFLKGGPVMWPLLLLSIVTTATVLERLVFVFLDRRKRDDACVQLMLSDVEHGDFQAALSKGEHSRDVIANVILEGLRNKGTFSVAILHAANGVLKSASRGLPVLDTAVTLAPLLGLLGTVTGLIRSFSFLGAEELTAPVAITGGIAEALIATAFGLSIAILALIPLNYLNNRVEETRHEIEDATNRLELFLFGVMNANPIPSIKEKTAH